MKTRELPIAKLVEDPANVRLHDERSLEAIKGSLARFGQQKPIVVADDGTVVAGNGTLAAARALGWEKINVVETTLEAADRVAYAIADNRTTELSKFDEDALAAMLGALNQDQQEATGFSAEEIRGLIQRANDDALEDDEVPEKPEEPVACPGDVYQLGPHRIACGDSTNPDHVLALIGGVERPTIMVTDPPYGVAYDPAWRHEAGVNNSERTGTVANDDRIDWTAAWELFAGPVAYVWHAGRFAAQVAGSIEDAGFEIRAQIIWAKSRFALSRGSYHWQHEPCWYAVRKGGKAHWIGDRSQSTVWNIQVTDDGDDSKHGTQKPLECMARPLRNHDCKVVYDPFLGTGSTLIAAHELDRVCLGMDIDPAWVDVAVQRWERRSGEKAKRVMKQWRPRDAG
jgi:DNA modification methylase